MREEKYKNVVLDTHQYLMVAEMNGCEQNVENYVSYVEELKKTLQKCRNTSRLSVGNGAYSILSLLDMTPKADRQS